MTYRVGIDHRRATWAPQVGLARYTRCLVDALLAIHTSGLELRQLDLSGGLTRREAQLVTLGRRHNLVARLVQEQVSMPRASRALDLLHLPWYEGPAWSRCPLIVTVHDLDTVDNRASYSLRFRAYYNTLLRIYMRTARHIIVPSIATLETLLARWPRKRCTVVPLAVDPAFEEPCNQQPQDPRFILYSGGFGHRKRLGDLLEAFAQVARADSEVRLVVVGATPPDFARTVTQAPARERIELRGYVGDPELVRLYHAATVVAYPSALEGFGFPVLEALATGTPLVATRAGSIPELAGDACLLVRPCAPKELADALLAVLEDEQLAARLAAAGRERNRLYSWSETAKKTMDVYFEELE